MRIDATPTRVRPSEALRFWAILGWISFGGPAGQIAILHQEMVERRKWIGEERFLHALKFCMLLPGPEAQQLATYAGWALHGTAGGVVAGLLFVLPSILVLLVLSTVYAVYGDVAAVAGVLDGIRPVVVAIVVHAAIRIGRRTLARPAHVALASVAFVGMLVLGIPFPAIVLAAGLVGMAGARLWPGAFAPRVGGESTSREPASTPARGRTLRLIAIGVALWLVPYVALVAWRGAESVHAAEYRFFSKAALVTFGGAYAVLGYVAQAASGSLGWLTHAQTVDGLALAETTPGPLIMVVQFVAFQASWTHPEGLNPFVSAVAGALLTTYVTFLPSFVLVLIGAPYVEKLRDNRALAGALSGVTAAVVGVILFLATILGRVTLWPRGSGAPDPFGLALLCLTLVALQRGRVSVPALVAAGGVAGLLRVAWPG